MTNLEALQATVAGYPIATNTYIKALTDRGITSTATYAGGSQAFDLATADVYMVLATAVNITEGGYTISVTDKQSLMKIANGLFSKWGYPIVGDVVRKVKSVQPW